ncbi:hypothetical protein FSP39_000206 [Pinctada imbricata]|uniref:Uncharacterized protein n=1 Tax=Pinctada imbricata TaxID=66713 RepID=A0AA88Y8I5_PINIB|nr:hypothetical protein FSP39_000206 [Pinctada imbricata]
MYSKFLSDILRDRKRKNWLIARVGLDLCTSALSSYVLLCMEDLYSKLYRQNAALPPCVDECCVKKRNRFSEWCYTCNQWKTSLMRYSRSSKKQKGAIIWDCLNVHQWGNYSEENIQCISNVFIFSHDHEFRTDIRRDLSSLLSVIHNCRYFDDTFISGKYLDKVRTARNQYLAHNAMSLDDKEKDFCLQAFLRMLSHPRLACYNDTREVVKKIKKLQHDVEMETLKDYDVQNIMQLIESRHPIEDEAIIDHSKTINRNVKRISFPSFFTFNSSNILLLLFLYFVGFLLDAPNRKETNITGCVDMEYTHPWPSEINFRPYIENKTDLVGRTWLYNEIETALINSTYGVFLTAEMGYGKSAIMSYLSCVTESSLAGYWIRKNMVSFHMCRFDALDTLKPEYFIQNIAAGIANRIPEFGNILHEDRLGMDYITSFRCSEDPLGCLDRVLLYPASRLQHSKEELIIAIDGLDECLELKSDRPNIVSVLEIKIAKLRGVAKLLITSRKHKKLESSLRLLKRLNLLSSDERNRRDIDAYLDRKLESRIMQKAKRISKNVFEVEDSNRQKIIDASEGNFLFVIQLLNSSPFVDEFPQSLQQLFLMNFDRAFGQTLQSFEIVRPVLEVIVASYNPLSLGTMMEIAEIGDSNRKLVKECFNGKLGYFFSNENGTVTFFHKAVSDFLLSDEDFNKFFISKQNGHKRISHFLLKTKSNVIKLMQHISESKIDKLKDIFITHGKSLIRSNNFSLGDNASMNILHKVARSLDSYAATKLLLRVTGCRHVDVHTLTNVSAVFLASAYGNKETLRALFQCGANLKFRRLEPPIIPDGIFNIHYVDFCKQNAFWGYNSLHIAAQHGHKHVVQFLLRNAPELLFSENSIGLNPFQLAVEFGHVDVARLLLRKRPSFPDAHSLYYAAKNNHIELLKLILSFGIKDECLPCNGSMYWLKEYDITKDFISFKFRNSDDFRLMYCQSSLEIAVQLGNTEIVDILLNQTENAIHCRDSRGRTPILTAVQHGKDVIFQHLLDAGANISDVCLGGQNFSKFELYMSKTEIQQYQEETCPLYASVAHLATIYGRRDILDLIPNYLMSSKDSINATPLHYGMCHKHIDVIGFLIFRGFSASAKTLNGSTPIHSAASCGSYIILFLLEERGIVQESFELTDNLNRSFMHNLFILVGDQFSRGLSTLHVNQITDNSFMHTYFLKSKYIKLHVHLKDKYKRTYMHYAAIFGHVHFFDLYMSELLNFDTDQSVLLQETDEKNNSVVDLLFYSLPFFNTVGFHRDCPLDEMFYKHCNVNHSLILSPHETCLLYTFQRFHWNHDIFSMTKLQKYIKHAIKQNSLNSIVIMKSYTKDRFHAAVEQIMPWILRNIIEYDKTGFMVSLFFNKSFDFCNRRFEESILHKVMHNDNNKLWVHSPFYGGSPIRTYLSLHVENCFDKSGYNLLQRAVSGGHQGAIKFLLEKKVSLSVTTRTGADVLSLLIVQSPSFERTEFFKNSFYTAKQEVWNNEGIEKRIFYKNDIKKLKSYDSVGELLLQQPDIREMAYARLKLNECLENSYALSTIHILAAKGLKSIIEYAVTKYGKDILNCRNRHNFTAYFFADIFGHEDTLKYLNDSNVDIIKPDRHAELFILMDALSHFFDKKSAWYFNQMCEASDEITFIKTTKKLCNYVEKSATNISNSLSFDIASIASITDDLIKLYEKLTLLYNEIVRLSNMSNMVNIEETRRKIVNITSLLHLRIFETKFNVLRRKTKYDISANLRNRLFFRMKRVLGDPMDSNLLVLCENIKTYEHLTFLGEEEKKFISHKEDDITLRSVLNLYEPTFDDLFHSVFLEMPDIKIEVERMNYTSRVGPQIEDYALTDEDN